MTLNGNKISAVSIPDSIIRRNDDTDFFLPVIVISLCIFGYVGFYFRAHNPPEVSMAEVAAKMQQTHFIIEEERPAPRVEPPPEVKKETPAKEEVIDLTQKPLLAQEKNETVESPPETQVQKPVRRVYGLKKVYSTGIGASGNASDAIIGKLGNTLNTEIDTIKATESDLSGTPVSITTVTTYPRLKNTVKPEYTKEMLENRIEGVVRVKIIVDIDGRVKQVIVLDDLGYGSKQKVAEACFKMTFEPARVGDTPVCTAILMRIRFEMLNG
jgi:periplasmic protein TonB